MKSVELIKQAMDEATGQTEGKPLTQGRHHREEAFSEIAEKANVEGGSKALDAYLSDFGHTAHHSKGIIAELFANGKPGKYVARSKTLTEKTAGILKK